MPFVEAKFDKPYVTVDPVSSQSTDKENFLQDSFKKEQDAIYLKTGVLTQDAVATQQKIEADRLKLNQEANIQLGGNFDPTTELDNNTLEFDMAGSKSLTAKQQKFKDAYPNGILTPLAFSDQSVRMVYKINQNDPNEPFKFVNRGVNNPEIARSLLSGELLAGVVATRAGPLAVGGAVGAGSLLETGVEYLRGFETNTITDELGEAAVEGFIAGGVDAATRKLFRLYKKIKAGGNIQVLDTVNWASDVARFAETETLEPLVKGNVLKTPLWQSVFAQTKVTSPRAVDTQLKQTQVLQEKFGSMASTFDADAFSKGELSLIVKAQADDLVQKLFASTNLDQPLSRDFVEVGENYVKGLQNWNINTRTLRDSLYDQAFAVADDVVFDLNPLVGAAQKVTRVIVSKGKKQASQEINTGLLDETGQPITRLIEPSNISVALNQIPKEVSDVVKVINQLDPRLSMYQGINPIEQLKTLRTSIFQLQQSEDPIISSAGNKLYNAVRDVMETPLSGNKEFLDVYQKASSFNRWRESIKNLSVIKKSLKTDSVEDIIQTKFNITQPSEVSYIKKVLDKKTFDMLKSSYLLDIANNKATLNRFVTNEKRYADVVNKIFSKSEVNAINVFKEAQDSLQGSKLVELVKADVTNAQRALGLIDEGFNVFKNTLEQQGGKNSKFATSIKSGIYKQILDAATETSETGGVNSLNVTKLSASINKLKNNKAVVELLLSPEEIARLENFNLYAQAINVTDDVGGAMQKGSLSAQTKNIPDALGKIKVASTYLSNSVYARILTQNYKAGDKILINKAANETMMSEQKLRALAVMITQLSRNMSDEEKITDVKKAKMKGN